MQYTGFGGTRELETFRLLNRARNLDGVQGCAAVLRRRLAEFHLRRHRGNIGYFTTGEVPLREDLQANTVTGAPPWFIRNGQGGNEWLVNAAPGPTDGSGYLAIPAAELPQVVNPSAGFVVNANNDPAGVTLDNNPVNQLRPGNNGIYYLGYSFDFGTRAGRITQALRQKLARGRVDQDDMRQVQADVVLLDARCWRHTSSRPSIMRERAERLPPWRPSPPTRASPRLSARLRAWDYTAPTGVDGGYDAADQDGYRLPPSQREVKASVAATIYSVWRGQVIGNGLDLTLNGLGVPTPGSGEAIKAIRHLVERDGIGESTIDFFAWTRPARGRAAARFRRAAAACRTRWICLRARRLRQPSTASTNQADYRWGRLHRIVFDAPLGAPFSIPGATPGFPPSFADLDGLSVDGGFGVVDASSHNARAASAEEFRFGSGPNRRYVGSPGTVPGSIEADRSCQVATAACWATSSTRTCWGAS